MRLNGLYTLPAHQVPGGGMFTHRSALGQSAGVTTSTTGTLAGDITTGVQALGTAVTTLQLENINLKRAEQGLPPLDASQVSPTVNVGLSSTTLMVVAGVALLVLLSLR